MNPGQLLLLLSFLGIARSEKAPQLSCCAHCYSFKCDLPPAFNLSRRFEIRTASVTGSIPYKISRNASPCFPASRNPHLYVITTILPLFQRWSIYFENELVFQERPCVVETSPFRVQIGKGGVVSLQRPEAHLWNCYLKERAEARVRCLSERGEAWHQEFVNFSASSTETHRLDRLRPFTKYNCSSQIRYLDIDNDNNSYCISRWSDGGYSAFRTDPSLPSAAPTPLGFQRHGADCYVYFKAVPPALLNGEIQNYGWKCGEQNRNSSLFSFSVDCASRRCSLWARNQKGNGPRSRPLMLRDDVQRPRLQLWSEGSGVRPVVEGASREGSSLIICGCGACEGEQPSCVSMTTRPLGSGAFRVDLRSQRVAVMRNDSSGPVMSEWVSCSYDPEAAIRTFPLEEIADVKELLGPHGDRLEVRIPSVELRCPRATKPIDVVTVRQSCGSPGGPDVFFRRRAGQSTLKFDISWRPGCQLLLSVDNASFAQVYPRQHSSVLPFEVVFGVVVGGFALFVLVFLIIRSRPSLVNLHKTLCDDPRYNENDFVHAPQNYCHTYIYTDSADGYATITEKQRTSADSGVCLTSSREGSADSVAREGYTDQLNLSDFSCS